MPNGHPEETPEAGPTVEVLAVTIYPPNGPPFEVPVAHVVGNAPGVVMTRDPATGVVKNYNGFPYTIEARAGAVLAPGGPRIIRGA